MSNATPFLIVLIGLTLFLLCACQSPPVDKPLSPDAVQVHLPLEEALPAPSAAPAATPEPKAYALLVHDSAYAPARYEPVDGCYLGAYILEAVSVEGSIPAFERRTGKSHAIYVNEMPLGGTYPVSWVLSCIANGKTPYLIVNRPNSYAPFDLALLEQTARDAGAFDVPVFIELLPYAKAEKYSRAEYLAFFAAARAQFSLDAPNAVLVWCAEEAEDSQGYYPGHENVDWVNIKGEPSDEAVADFIQAYQRHKPIILTLAISHYSTENNAYDLSGAAQRIAAAYADCPPRVKVVLYRDVNEMLYADEGVRHDFTVTTEDSLTKAYQSAISGAGFLSGLVAEARTTVGALMQAVRPGYAVGDTYYIAEESILADLGAHRILPGRRAVSIHGAAYYDMAFARECVPLDFYIDEAKGRMVVLPE